ncbi:MAG TPA: glycosyltransferase family 1 protein [Mucilaginibacter sp.]|nr:glycosyltransferase family 1 protein [Mucilaginibacter sp.]
MPKSLTIGVDVRDLQVAKTGTRTYLEEICREFKKMEDAGIRFYFFDTGIPVYNGDNKLLKYIEHARFQLWKQLRLPLKAFFKNCDIVFCTDSCVPLIHLGYKTIPVFHDAFCFENPENYGRLWLWLYLKTAVPAAKRSPFVITPTEWSKKQIDHFTGLSKEKLVVVYEGPKYLNYNIDPAAEDALLKSFNLNRQNYILHVGSMFKRKNLPALVQAFGKVKSQGYPELKLVLVGPLPTHDSENDYREILNAIKNCEFENDVVLTSYLPDQSLASLYANALMYVFPSVNEGFGIPVLEAFKNNLPVLVADNTCLPEVGGDAVLTFDPYNTDDMALKMTMVLNDAGLRYAMKKKGQERLQHFSWQKTASQLVDIFRKAV